MSANRNTWDCDDNEPQQECTFTRSTVVLVLKAIKEIQSNSSESGSENLTVKDTMASKTQLYDLHKVTENADGS